MPHECKPATSFCYANFQCIYLRKYADQLSTQKFGISNEFIRVKLYHRKQNNKADVSSIGPSFIWREEGYIINLIG